MVSLVRRSVAIHLFGPENGSEHARLDVPSAFPVTGSRT